MKPICPVTGDACIHRCSEGDDGPDCQHVDHSPDVDEEEE